MNRRDEAGSGPTTTDQLEARSSSSSRHFLERRAPGTGAILAAAIVLGFTVLPACAGTPVSGGTGTEPTSADGVGAGPATGPSPPPAGEELWAVDAASADDVWAVGVQYRDGSYRSRSLILHWDGGTWSKVPSPDVGRLTDVTAPSHDAAWAVGGDQILFWDSSTWEVVAHSAPADSFFSSIDASGPADAWVVGVQDGAHWVDEDGERNAGFDTLAMHWDGSAWSVIPSPNGAPRHNFLQGVVALAPGDAWAVGYSQVGRHPRTLTIHWDGSSWSLVPSPDPGIDFNVLWGIGTDGVSGVWALGHYGDPDSHFQALYLRWTATGWDLVAGPHGDAQHQTPTALSGASAGEVWAVGSEPTSSFLVAQWEGSSWSVFPAEVPSGPDYSASLTDVVAISPTDAWAVGRYRGMPAENGGSEILALVEHWDGAHWRLEATPGR
jgi:hypothetical protein